MFLQVLTRTSLVPLTGHKELHFTVIQFQLAEGKITKCDTLAYKSWSV